MAKIRVLTLILCSIVLNATIGTPQVFGTDNWNPEDMDPRIGVQVETISKIANVVLLPEGSLDTPDGPCNEETPCTFALHYFTGLRFDPKNDRKKNILYIPGGPGNFINEKQHASRALELLGDGGIEHINEGRNNVVYFHIRGTGQSIIEAANTSDRFLRSRYIIHDIERLRRELLGEKPWDAIYAHSWGSVVAQLYAEEYGKPDNPKVKSLIVSAPVTRARQQTLDFRTRKTSSNLESIYAFYKPNGACSCVEPSYLSELVVDFKSNRSIFDESDNLCFLSEHVQHIKETVEGILRNIDADYGSLDFVIENFGALKNDHDFRTGGRFPYPVEFFSALRIVQMSGAPLGPNPLVFADDTKLLIDAALLIGNHLVLATPINSGTQCDANEPFSKSTDGSCGNTICERMKKLTTERLSSVGLQSRRANYVFGVYDGIARWVFKALKRDCFTGEDLRNFANEETSSSDPKKFLRAHAKRIGIVSEESVCGWDPGKHKHAVPSLILKGTSDAIIAGCQAEDFYNDGLSGPRVLLEFRGSGHTMSVSNKGVLAAASTETMAFVDILEEFIKAPAAITQFRGAIAEKLQIVRAEEVKPGLDGKVDLGKCLANG